MTRYFRVNTNRDHFPSGEDGTIVYDRGVVATFSEEYADDIAKLNRDDVVFSYVDGVGYRAVGTVERPYDGNPVTDEWERLGERDVPEHHIPVEWEFTIAEEDALSYSAVNEIVGYDSNYTHRGTVRQFLKPETKLERLRTFMRRRVVSAPRLWLGVSGSDPTNLETSVGNKIDESVIRGHSGLDPGGDAYLWGSKAGKLQGIQQGDWFLFSTQAHFPYAAQVADIDDGADALGDAIWQPSGGNDFERVFLLENRRQTELSREEFAKVVDYGKQWSAMRNGSISTEPLANVEQKFGGVESFIDAIATDGTSPPHWYTDFAEQLEQQKQVVFHGPPGTGKTHQARQFAEWWVTQHPETVQRSDQFKFVTFHPSFTYEDFIEGLSASSEDGTIDYEMDDGLFKEFVESVQAWDESENWSPADFDHEPRYVMIIDEINRGDVSQIFGELVTLLEPDKRGGADNEITVRLAHSDDQFSIPENVYLIGTMNTADRSVALVDAALRRRFGFNHFPPDYDALRENLGFADRSAMEKAYSGSGISRLQALAIGALDEINQTIRERNDLGRGKQIGHSYLWDCHSESALVRAWKREILPLIEEYFFSSFDDIQNTVFGEVTNADNLIDWDRQEIRPKFQTATGVSDEADALAEVLEELVNP